MKAAKAEQGRGTLVSVPGYGALISKKDAAGLAGVSVRTVERLVSSGELRKKKIRGCVRLFLSEVMSCFELQPTTQQP